jgi:hypothetical protein
VSKRIYVDVHTDGSVTIGVEGACGPECAELTKPFEEALGTVIEETLLPEYYQQQEIETKVNR